MLPNLYKNRHGTYYLRLTIGKREIKRSLGTKEPARAKLAAIAFAWIRAMDLKKPLPYPLPPGLDLDKLRELKVVVHPDGRREFSEFETDDDARRAAIFARAVDAGASADDLINLSRDGAPGMSIETKARALMASLAIPTVGKTQKFSAACAMYLAEKKVAGNRDKTISDKKSSYDAFQEMHGDLDMNAYDDAMALGWKNRLIASGIATVRINTKLSQFNDLFDWAQRNRLRLIRPLSRQLSRGLKIKRPFDWPECCG